MKGWRRETYSTAMSFQCKEKRRMEEGQRVGRLTHTAAVQCTHAGVCLVFEHGVGPYLKNIHVSNKYRYPNGFIRVLNRY